MPRDELIDFNSEEFLNFSILVPDLLKKMLEINPRKRMSARDVMNNKWVSENYKNYKKKFIQEMRRTANSNQYTAVFLAFNAKKIKRALFSYFANIFASAEDKEYFGEMFRMLDKDGDGVLTAEEFEEAMSKYDSNDDNQKLKELTQSIVKKGQSMELHGNYLYVII